MVSKIVRHSKWILALLCFYPILSFPNESFSDVCKYQEELKINDKKKCLYKCQKSIRFSPENIGECEKLFESEFPNFTDNIGRLLSQNLGGSKLTA